VADNIQHISIHITKYKITSQTQLERTSFLKWLNHLRENSFIILIFKMLLPFFPGAGAETGPFSPSDLEM